MGYKFGFLDGIKSALASPKSKRVTSLYSITLWIQTVGICAGFEDGERACCGTGPYGGSGHCGRDDETTGDKFELCTDSNEYIWWDPYHPTERVHEQFAKTVWNGSMPYVEPLNANELFRIMDAPLCEDNLNTLPGTPIVDVIRHITSSA